MICVPVATLHVRFSCFMQLSERILGMVCALFALAPKTGTFSQPIRWFADVTNRVRARSRCDLQVCLR